MSWRRFQVVLNHLPIESAYKTAVRDATDLSSLPEPDPDRHGPWSHEAMLLAGIFDRVGQLAWMQTDGKNPPPPPYPRPGVASNVWPINPAAHAYLEYLQAHHGEAPPEGWEPEVA
jgi:hypothetical protein